ncbi:hypothetical protein Fmac_016696 [Flemingia macrophylla]|uniref:Uncharacterized protein n=1 Tax=Flemingia macrophylla TaxID=520843 RepID=A0ABD1MI69_9FABA
MASLLMVPFQPILLKRLQRSYHTKTSSKSIRNEKTSSFSFRSKANVPLYELPGASFDQYMDDKHRVLRAVFSDDKGLTTQQLNEEEWRITMRPIQCLFLNVKPTADVRLTFKSNGEDYPPHIPHHITKVLELHFIRWELQGLNTFNKDPYHVRLDVKGSLYPERMGRYSWLKNQMEMKITFCVSPETAFIPEKVLKKALELVFKTVFEEMKEEFYGAHGTDTTEGMAWAVKECTHVFWACIMGTRGNPQGADWYMLCHYTCTFESLENSMASFDQYMDDKLRVLGAVFSADKGLTTQLNEEEWRITMRPIQCLFLIVKPTADVKLTFKSNGEDYPPHIPRQITKVLELHFIRWELQGLNIFNKDPYHVSLDVKSSLHPERVGRFSWLKNQIEMKITFCVSPETAFIPENVLKDALELVFKTVLEEMVKELPGRLLEDYNRFKKNKSKKNSAQT